MAERGRSLGMVINVTNTRRYYDRADIEGMMVGYKEILSPGKGFLNRKDVVKTFIKAVDEFHAENPDNDLLIGIHCSNGVNRAGYLICRYLVDRLGWSSHDAIDAFETARGYSFECGSYVQAIHKADREHRLKQQKASQLGGSGSEINAEDGERSGEDHPIGDGSARSEKDKGSRRKRKRKKPSSPGGNEVDDPLADIMPGFDPAFASQMMQQFFALEKQMKETAAKSQSGIGIGFPPPVVPPVPPLKIARATASPSASHVRDSSLPLAYSSPNPVPTPIPTPTAAPAMARPAVKVGGSVGPFPSLSLKTNTLAKTANFAFTTQKLKNPTTISVTAPLMPIRQERQQKPAFTTKTSTVVAANKDPLLAARAVAQSVSIAMELKGAEQISDDDDKEETQDSTTKMEEGEDDDGDDDYEDKEIDFNSMGRVDVKEYTASQQRRIRRKKLEKQFTVMKRGKFWEINQMRKEMGK